jgi:hypothetical protein
MRKFRDWLEHLRHSGGVTADRRGCRSETAYAMRFRRWVPAAAFAAFVTGYFVVTWYIDNIPEADQFKKMGTIEFGMWSALLGGVGGFAMAACVYFVLWLADDVRLVPGGVRLGTRAYWLGTVAIVLGTVFTALFTRENSEGKISKALTERVHPVSATSAILIAPGLVAFMALRSIASDDRNWSESHSCQMRLLIRLRREVRRLLTTFGAFLTLVVVATGIRRRALLAAHPKLPIPSEQVLLYGLIFAILLGLFYSAANSAIDGRAQRFLGDLAPLPSPADPALSEKLRRRNDLEVLIGVGGTWRNFETTTLIAAPLISALIGSATGG